MKKILLTLITLLFISGCGSHCENYVYVTKFGMCVIGAHEKLEMSMEQLDETIQITHNVFLEESGISNVDVKKVYQEWEIAIIFTDGVIDRDGNLVAGLYTPGPGKKALIEVSTRQQAGAINAFHHEMLHALLYPNGIEEHLFPYFMEGASEINWYQTVEWKVLLELYETFFVQPYLGDSNTDGEFVCPEDSNSDGREK